MHIHTSDQEKLDLGFHHATCNWGTHFCGLYETETERDEIILQFLHAGDVAGDLQLYSSVERTRKNFTDLYHKHFPECDGHVEDEKRFNFFGAKELYYPDGKFSPKAMDEGLNAYYTNSQKEGKRNVRATAEMSWALQSIPGIEDLMVYESRLNYFIPEKPWISICMYNTSKFDGSVIMKVLQTHPYIITPHTITQNPLYQNPETWLSENAPEFINKKL